MWDSRGSRQNICQNSLERDNVRIVQEGNKYENKTSCVCVSDCICVILLLLAVGAAARYTLFMLEG